jgi:uncharacterized C2H2 Zn-finger protein
MIINNILKVQLLAVLIVIGGCRGKEGNFYLECPKCDREFSEQRSLDQHYEAKHSMLQCPECDREFNEQRDLDQHYEAKHSMLECPECDREFNEQRDLDQHYEAKHCESSEEEEVFECYECDRQFNRQEDLERHNNAKHYESSEEEEVFECSECDRQFNRQEDLERHNNAKHYESSEEELFEDKQLTPYQGPDRRYGYYQCKCGKQWESANSWANTYQTCKRCDKKVYPYKQTELLVSENNASKKEHPQELCQKCMQLGYYCREYTQYKISTHRNFLYN